MSTPNPVISATGLFTPTDSISNEELVESYNAWAERFNAANAAAIEAGELPAERLAAYEKLRGELAFEQRRARRRAESGGDG